MTDEEIAGLAAFLGIGAEEFIRQYMRLRPDRRGLALLDQPDGACVFLEDGKCTVQSVKPQQCRDFPNLWRYPGAEKFCKAVPREVEEAEYLRLVTAATGRTEPEIKALVASPAYQARNGRP